MVIKCDIYTSTLAHDISNYCSWPKFTCLFSEFASVVYDFQKLFCRLNCRHVARGLVHLPPPERRRDELMSNDHANNKKSDRSTMSVKDEVNWHCVKINEERILHQCLYCICRYLCHSKLIGPIFYWKIVGVVSKHLSIIQNTYLDFYVFSF